MTARLETFVNACVLLTGWKRYLTAFIAGVLSAFALAPFYLLPIPFFTMSLMVWLMDGVYGDNAEGVGVAIRKAFLPGWWFGFGYFLAGLWWIGSAFLVEAEDFLWALPFAVIGFPAFLAVFYGFATLLARLFWSDHWLRVAGFAAAFALIEFTRGNVLTGFPWNTLGYAAMPNIVLMQAASIVGVYGMTFLAMIVFALPLVLLATPRQLQTTKWLPFVGITMLVLLQVGYGAWRLVANSTDYHDQINLRLVHPAIDQKDKFNPAKEEEILKTYLELSAQLQGEERNSLENTDYLIWPESVFPFLLTERRDVLASIADLLPAGTQLITGAMRAEPGAAGDPYGNVYNSVMLIAENGEIISAADKTHLVPFGEYLPFQSILESVGLEQLTRLRGGFEPGAERTILNGATGHAFLPLICYEIVFSGAIRQGFASPPQWIVNLTNDAWFGNTPGPYQHLHQSIIRAVEEGLPVVRVANMGVSGVVDPYGRMRAIIERNEKGVSDSALPRPAQPTFFFTWRHLPLFIFIVIGFVFSGFYRLKHMA